jgi:hypothetical protein
MLKTACATIALLALSNPALAACATQADAAALKTAVMQQELMVAALQCHETAAYNRFVIGYRTELQASDATLKNFFIKRGGEHGEAGYDAFKTKAANLSGLEEARDAHAFCADAHALFQAAARNDGTLAAFVETRSAPLDLGGVCAESRPLPVATRAAAPKPVLLKVADAAPVAGAGADIHADARPVAVSGVPDHAMGARPWRHDDPAPAARATREEDEDADDRDQAAPSYAAAAAEDAAPAYARAEEDDLPPPAPRAWQIRQRAYADDDAYAPPRPGYGPPSGWAYPPRPRYGWYGQPGYGW